MGSRYAAALQNTGRIALGGICDPRLGKDRIEQFACRAYKDEEALLCDPRIDVAIIAAPTELHKDLCIRAAERHKHVLVEKPMALTLPDARAMIGAAESNGVKLTLGMVERFNPTYRKIKEVMAQSCLGRVISVSVTRKTKSVNRPAWYLEAGKSGGVIVDLAIHDIDLLLWLLGDEVQTAYALSPGRHGDVTDTAMVLLGFRKGAIACLDVSWRLDPSYPSWGEIRMEILGERGMIAADAGALPPVYIAGGTSLPSFIHTQEDLKWSGIDLVREDVIRSMLESFAESIIGDTTVTPDGRDGLKALEVALHAVESLERKTPVTIGAKISKEERNHEGTDSKGI
jgi:predicted dehydrogenase